MEASRLLALAVAIGVLASLPLSAQPGGEIVIELGEYGADIEFDTARGQIYVSLPSANEIAVVSMETWTIVDRILAGALPQGIALSLDGRTLFAALNGAGAVAFVDPDTRHVFEVDVEQELDDSRTWDVVEARPDRVFVTANPGSFGLSHVAMIRRDLGNSASRVASNRYIRAHPVFAPAPDRQQWFVGEGFSPNSLYELDITLDTAPIVLEDQHGSVSGTRAMAVSPDSSRIYLASGQVLDTATFDQLGLVGRGLPALSEDGSLAYMSARTLPGNILIETHDTASFLKVGEYLSSCRFDSSGLRRVGLLPGGTGFAILGDDRLCITHHSPPPPSLLISPPSGTYLTDQKYDLAMIVESDGLEVAGVERATSDGIDVLDLVSNCLVSEMSDQGETRLLCHNFGRRFLRRFGVGTHHLEVSVRLSDGSRVEGDVTWVVPGDTKKHRGLHAVSPPRVR